MPSDGVATVPGMAFGRMSSEQLAAESVAWAHGNKLRRLPQWLRIVMLRRFDRKLGMADQAAVLRSVGNRHAMRASTEMPTLGSAETLDALAKGHNLGF